MAKQSAIAKAYIELVPTVSGLRNNIISAMQGDTDAAGKSSGESMGKKLVGALTGVVAAAGIGKTIKDAIMTDMDFDTSMSQIAATLGMTADQIRSNADGIGDTFKALRDKAQEMGAATNFSASEAADGLNILAMSGFTAEQSMDMIGDVLHLAAAGSMDMADAAGYVSGAMKGFSDSTRDSAYYADLMAKGATLANTNVSGLGEAISGGAAVAKSYSQSAESMTISLLRLAEQGDTGSAAATALAAAYKNLYAPTDQAKKALQELGVSAFKSNGEARDFNEVVNDLSKAMGKYSDETKTAYGQTIFGIQGFDAYNKMVVTSKEKQDEWAESLKGSMGEAARQYDTMTDNLQGDIDIWHSALDGFKIAVADRLMPAVRDIVKFGSDSMGQLTEAFQKEGAGGMAKAVGEIASATVKGFSDRLPDFLKAGKSMIEGLGRGISDNFGDFAERAGGAAGAFISRAFDFLPDFVKTGMEYVGNMASGILENLPTAITAVGDVLKGLASKISENMPEIMQKGWELTKRLAAGIVENLPSILTAAARVMAELARAILSNLPQILSAGVKILLELLTGIISAIPKMPGYIKQVAASIKGEFASVNWGELGTNIINGLISGITSGIGAVVDAVKNLASSVVGAAKKALDINSPSRVMEDKIGKWIPLGIAEGMDEYSTAIDREMDSIAGRMAGGFMPKMEGSMRYDLSGAAGGASHSVSLGGVTININGADRNPEEIAEAVNDELGNLYARMEAAWA